MSFAVLIIGNSSKTARVPCHPVPMTVADDNDDDTWALFPTRGQAQAAARKHPLCRAVGFKVIEWEFSEPNTRFKKDGFQ